MNISINARATTSVVMFGITILAFVFYAWGASNMKHQLETADPMADSGISLGYAAWMAGGGALMVLLSVAFLSSLFWTRSAVKSARKHLRQGEVCSKK